MNTEKLKNYLLENCFGTENFSKELLRSLSPAQIIMDSCCMWFEAGLQKGIARGDKWVYTNSSAFANQRSTFDHLVESGKYGLNCAMPAGWAYIDMGMLEEGMRFWGNKDGQIAHIEQLGQYIEPCCDIIGRSGELFSELFCKGLVKPGDVFMGKGHTFVYLGDEKFLAAGHDGRWHADDSVADKTEDPRHAVFDSWFCDMKTCSNYNYHVYWQLSLKEDYVPKTFRNRKGKIAAVPEL